MEIDTKSKNYKCTTSTTTGTNKPKPSQVRQDSTPTFFYPNKNIGYKRHLLTHKNRETLAVAESKSPAAESLTNSFTNLGKYFLGR